MTTTNGTYAGKSFDTLRRIARSNLPRALHAVLTQLYIHANPDLTVRHSEAELARECRYTAPTVRVALHQLKAAKLLRIPPRMGHHREHATVYQIDLTPLQDHPDIAAITDPDHEPEAASETARQTDNSLRFETENGLPFAPQTDNSARQTENSFPPIGFKAKTKKNFLARETKETDLTLAPDHLDLPPTFLTWCQNVVPELDVDQERDAFLGYCRRHEITNQSWLGAFKDWLLKAQARRQRGEPIASDPKPSRRPATAPTPTLGARPKSCSISGCGQPQCPHTQACRYHATDCQGCADERAAEVAIEAGIAAELAAEQETPAEGIPVTAVDAWAEEVPEEHGGPLPAEVQAQVDGFLGRHTLSGDAAPLTTRQLAERKAFLWQQAAALARQEAERRSPPTCREDSR